MVVAPSPNQDLWYSKQQHFYRRHLGVPFGNSSWFPSEHLFDYRVTAPPHLDLNIRLHICSPGEIDDAADGQRFIYKSRIVLGKSQTSGHPHGQNARRPNARRQ